MNNRELKLYIEILKQKTNISISENLLEKDYVLSLFLSNWAKRETPNLDKLIFKGGTLLTKNYLKYHRISEDLDFTHEDANEIRKIKTEGRRETKIKERIIPIIEEIKKIAEISKLEFEEDRTNEKYVILRNSRRLYILNLYYKSFYTNLESSIKIEISFFEDLINNPEKLEIKNIIDYYPLDKVEFKLTNYNLVKPILNSYSIEETILEKIRATVTREQC